MKKLSIFMVVLAIVGAFALTSCNDFVCGDNETGGIPPIAGSVVNGSGTGSGSSSIPGYPSSGYGYPSYSVSGQ